MTSIRNTQESADEFTARMRGRRVVVIETVNRNIPTDGTLTKWEPVTLKAGERVIVVGMTNAGFRGMELSIRKADGTLVTGLSENLFTRWA